ncbi:hypothetical protein AX14_011106 [Amanita brunnescens Koide BX004]|nr:hypothetical protein AX14_011106 [Amanita brunnescens Koide BX004]
MASRLPSAHIGELGLWIQAGERMAGILDGPKPLPLNCSSEQSHSGSPGSHASASTATIEESSRGGGKGGAATQPSMESLGDSTTWSEVWDNPADPPSRGIQPPWDLLLPPVEVDQAVRPFITDASMGPSSMDGDHQPTSCQTDGVRATEPNSADSDESGFGPDDEFLIIQAVKEGGGSSECRNL